MKVKLMSAGHADLRGAVSASELIVPSLVQTASR